MSKVSALLAPVLGVLVATSFAPPAWSADHAPSTPPGANEQHGPPTWSSNARSHHVRGAEMSAAFKAGNSPRRTGQERVAVAEYMDHLPTTSARLDPRDVKVATVRTKEGLEATLVAPVEAEANGMDLVIEPDTGRVSAGVDWSLPDTVPTTAGPGMGSWQNWDDLTIYKLELKLYSDAGSWNDYLGRAEFETANRRFLENPVSTVWDRWQVRRKAVAIPQTWDSAMVDTGMRVSRLWLSNNPINQSATRGWLFDGEGGTYPLSNTKICNEGGSFTVGYGAGSFTVPIDNCEEFDVWRGDSSDEGHYRIDYNQGSWVDAGQRILGYTSGYEIANGVSAANTFYEFVSLSIGNPQGVDDDRFKCTSTEKGAGATDSDSCWYYNGSNGGTDAAS